MRYKPFGDRWDFYLEIAMLLVIAVIVIVLAGIFIGG